MNYDETIVVITTTDSQDNAEHIVKDLLERRLAACIQRYTVLSSYRWEGKTEIQEEIRIEIKTRACLYETVQRRILALHTYELPEIVALPVAYASAAYRRWIEEETDAFEA